MTGPVFALACELVGTFPCEVRFLRERAFAELFPLAVISYEMLTGQPPFSGRLQDTARLPGNHRYRKRQVQPDGAAVDRLCAKAGLALSIDVLY